MTRKQALLKAVEILREDTDNSELIRKLQECIDELPFAKWTESAIFDACDQFVLDNGRSPSTKDFESASLPSHPTIRNRFNMTAKEFRDKFYPQETSSFKSPYGFRGNGEWLSLFSNEYIKIRPSSGDNYNRLRDKSTPTWKTLCKMAGLDTWSELKSYLNLPTYKKNSGKDYRKYKVTLNLE